MFKKGDLVIAYDGDFNEIPEDEKLPMIFLAYIEGARTPYVVVAPTEEDEYNFKNGLPFEMISFENGNGYPTN